LSAGANTQSFLKLVSNTLKYSASGIVIRLLSVISIPLYLKFLPSSSLGIYSITLLNENILTIISGYAITNALGKFYVDNVRKGADRGVVVGTAFFSIMGLGIAAVILLLLFASFISRLTLDGSSSSLLVTKLISFSFLANLASNMAMAIWQLDQRIRLFFWCNFIKYTLSTIIGLLAVALFNMGVIGIVIGWVVGSIVVGSISIVWMSRAYLMRFEPKVLLEMFRYGTPLVPAAFMMLLLNGFDRYLLKTFSGLDVVGLYAVAISLAMALNLAIVTPFKQAWAPIMWKMRGQENERMFHAKTLTYYLMVQVFIFCGVIIFSDIGMFILSGGKQEFVAISMIVPMIYLGTIFFWHV
jgi:O-antigen/teichoic acid export membrane protein